MKIFTLNTTSANSPDFIMPMQTFIKGINHRGYSTEAPENTLPAYILSAKKGFRYVECDISLTSDNIPVLLHDDTIDRTSNGTGAISSMTLATAKSYDFGSWKNIKYRGTKIPTFEEFIILCRNLGLHPYIELKNTTAFTDAQLQNIVDIVKAYGMSENSSYISFTMSYLSVIGQYDKYARLGFLTSKAYNSKIVNDTLALRNGTNKVFLDLYSKVYSSYISACKSNALPIEIWTVNGKSNIKSIDGYVSGVTSDNTNAEFVLYEAAIS